MILSGNIAVICDKIHFSYTKNPFIEDLSIELPFSQITGLFGPNGAGKTTLLNLIYNKLKPGKGEITIFNKKYRLNSESIIKREIGYMPQSPSLFSHLTLEENIRLAAYLYKISPKLSVEKTEKLIDLFNLQNVSKKLFKELSGGQKRISNFIAAIIHKPKLLLLDEPYEGLDIVNQEKVNTIINDFVRNGSAVFVSSHIIEPLEKSCYRYLIMADGKIIKSLDSMEFTQMETGLTDIIKKEINLNAIQAFDW